MACSFEEMKPSGDESPAYKAAPHEWGWTIWTIRASRIHLAIFSSPGVYAGAMTLHRCLRTVF
jgi:hypothetical protein